MMSHNAQVWQACLLGPNRNACTSTSFLEGSCAQFPTLIMKIVRLRLNLTQQLLEDSTALPGLKVPTFLYKLFDYNVFNCERMSFCFFPKTVKSVLTLRLIYHVDWKEKITLQMSCCNYLSFSLNLSPAA